MSETTKNLGNQRQPDAGAQIVLPILYPDRVATDGLISTLRAGHDRQFLHQLMVLDAGESSDVVVSAVDVFLAAAGETRCRMFVQDYDREFAFEIMPEAWRGLRPGFLAIESLRTGSFIIVPRLLRHAMPELELDGQPLLIAKPPGLGDDIEPRATSASERGAIVRSVIEDAVANDEELTNAELAARVQGRASNLRISKRQIRQIAGPLKPEHWKRPGARRKY